MMMLIKSALERLGAWWHEDFRVVQEQGDTLPAVVRKNSLVHMVDAGKSWSVGFQCPCGCGEVIELLLLPEVEPHWSLTVDRLNRPTLSPSVWKATGCRSHFWMRGGRIVWAR